MVVAIPSFVVELEYIKVAVLTVELIVQITAISADPMIVKSVDCQRSTISKHDGLSSFINPETQFVFGVR